MTAKSICAVPPCGSEAFASLTRMWMLLTGVSVGSVAPPAAGSSVSTFEKFEPETAPWFETLAGPEYGLSIVTWKAIVTESLGASVPTLTETVPPAPWVIGWTGYTRADAAVFYNFSERLRAQANVENLLGARYYANADGNNNISPGSPRAVRFSLIAKF